MFLNWGLFVEDFPEEILQDLHRTDRDQAFVEIRKSHLYKRGTAHNLERISHSADGIGYWPIHLIDFHDVPDSM